MALVDLANALEVADAPVGDVTHLLGVDTPTKKGRRVAIESLLGKVPLPSLPVAATEATAQDILASIKLKNVTDFFASGEIYPVGARINTRDNHRYDIVAPGAGDFIHPVSGVDVRLVPNDGTLSLYAVSGLLVSTTGTVRGVATPVTNADAAFTALFKALVRTVGTTTVKATSRLFIPPPANYYQVTQPGAFGPQTTLNQERQGLEICGGGRGNTTIVLALAGATADDKVMWTNRDSWRWCTFRDLAFFSEDAETTFMETQCDNFAHDFIFDRCRFSGSWRRGHYIHKPTGSTGDLGSEFIHIDCSFICLGVTDGWIYIPPAGTAGGTDQSLNYVFERCKIWIGGTGAPASKWIQIHKGGHVKITECDFSGWNNGLMFELRGSSGHADGVMQFVCENSRFECKHATAVQTMYCEWEGGTVSFKDCDWSSQRPTYAPATINFQFVYANTNGPNISFENCQLLGTTNFTYGVNDGGSRHSVLYKNSTQCSHIDWYQQFTFTASSGTNHAGHPAIKHEGVNKGSSILLDVLPIWAPSTAYTVGQTVTWRFSGYSCSAAGTSDSGATNGPYSKDTNIVDGTGTLRWDYYRNRVSDYIVEGVYPADVLHGAGLTRRIAYFRRNTGTMAANSTFQGGSWYELILPPNVWVTAVHFYAAAGAYTTGPGNAPSITVRNRAAVPVDLAALTTGTLGAGFNQRVDVMYNTGTTIATRALAAVMGASMTDSPANAFLAVEYVC